uniref:Plexin domain-containing protein 2 n=1 Tax=Panagrolaimus sp. JU765 TaxID=591449 RepID=A0AC34QH92_9BILA
MFWYTLVILYFVRFTSTTELIDYTDSISLNSPQIKTLFVRQKRESDPAQWLPTRPADYEVENESDASNTTTEHTYYNMTIVNGDKKAFEQHYVDMKEWLANKNVSGNSTHDHLHNAYRKAAGIKLKFEFPFYGHKLVNVTIATGGFLYVGDQTHSWLAATQYIAPLMANFDTMSNSSSIIFGDDGNRFVVEWSNVKLRDDPNAGVFSFQASLFANGDIWFVYKDIPISVTNISDANHPCKLGVSDAYLFNHKMKLPNDAQATSKKVIHEYHRISIEREKILSNTVVVLKALPTCLMFNDCNSCANSTLKFFQCTWCQPNEGESGFCSDADGLHRRRQDFVEGYCNRPKKDMCEALPSKPATKAILPDSKSHPDAIVSLSTEAPKSHSTGATPEEKSWSHWKTFLVLFFCLSIVFAFWVYYAYNNPYSWSGQMLIKYRKIYTSPANQVRYSASGHM